MDEQMQKLDKLSRFATQFRFNIFGGSNTLDGLRITYVSEDELIALLTRLEAAEAKAAGSRDLLLEAKAVASNAYRTDAGSVARAQRLYDRAEAWLARYDACSAAAQESSTETREANLGDKAPNHNP